MNLKTTLHRYYFDISKPADAEAYEELCARLKATPGRGPWHNAVPSDGCVPPAKPAKEEIELETKHLFQNQWNTPTERVFDWYESYWVNNRKIRAGHYLDITDEMRAIRANTLACGYSGRQFPKDCGMVFNTTPEVLASEYMKERDLPLLRLMPVDAGDDRPQLTPEEKAFLLPLWKEARGLGKTERAKKRLAELSERFHREYKETLEEARIQRDGKLWILARGLDNENAIYYTHTGRWCFGWLNPLTEAEESAILDVISEFPFAYDLKCQDSKRNKGSA